MPDLIDALAELPGTAQTLPDRGPFVRRVGDVLVDLPTDKLGGVLFPGEPQFEEWWSAGLSAAILSRDVDSVKLVLALGLKHGLA